jgi:hypothetical protein
MPCHPHSPRHKGKVERSARHVRDNALGGRDHTGSGVVSSRLSTAACHQFSATGISAPAAGELDPGRLSEPCCGAAGAGGAIVRRSNFVNLSP